LTAIPGVEVIPCGPFSRSEISRVYDSFDILLCPSSVDNSPNVVIEALSHGRPVIAQLGTGMDSYISTDTGRLIDFGGDSRSVAADLTVATEEILSDYECFSRQASEYVRSKLSPKVVGNAYLQLYRELLTKGS
jgi:glycosyltransferase involved in cell wall biosynthesis